MQYNLGAAKLLLINVKQESQLTWKSCNAFETFDYSQMQTFISYDTFSGSLHGCAYM